MDWACAVDFSKEVAPLPSGAISIYISSRIDQMAAKNSPISENSDLVVQKYQNWPTHTTVPFGIPALKGAKA